MVMMMIIDRADDLYCGGDQDDEFMMMMPYLYLHLLAATLFRALFRSA